MEMPYKVTNATSVINLFLIRVLNVVIDIKIHIWPFKLKETQPKCNLCCKTFLRKKAHTGKTPYHPYECNHCKNKCPSPSELKTHMMTHTDEKPYQCNHCGKAFTVNKSLINHLRIHLGKNYINAAIVT